MPSGRETGVGGGALRGDVAGLRAELEPGEAGVLERPRREQPQRPRGVAAAAERRVHAVADPADLRRPGLAQVHLAGEPAGGDVDDREAGRRADQPVQPGPGRGGRRLFGACGTAR